MHAHEHVLDRRHLVEEADVLEGAADAVLDDLVGRQAGELVPVEHDAPGRGHVHTREHVEERRLAGSVRPDERDDRPAWDREVDIVRRHEPTELLADALRDEEVVGHRSLSAPSCCTS